MPPHEGLGCRPRFCGSRGPILAAATAGPSARNTRAPRFVVTEAPALHVYLDRQEGVRHLTRARHPQDEAACRGHQRPRREDEGPLRRRPPGARRRSSGRRSTTAPPSTTSSSSPSPCAARRAGASSRCGTTTCSSSAAWCSHNGCIAEMRTGEGKTLVATLPFYLNALEGKGVHVVTVNDYLATRDAEWMGTIYKFLGMSWAPSSTRQTDADEALVPLGHHLRAEQRVRLRLPARQHEVLGARIRAAPAQLRHRRRSRLHPHRRSAHAAHHQRPGRALEREVPHHQRGHPRASKLDEHYVVDEKGLGRPSPTPASKRAEAARHPQPLRPDHARDAAHHEPVSARAHALQARRALHGVARRQGAHHRRVHRPRAPRATLVRRPASGGRSQGTRADSGRESHHGDHHLPESLPHSTRSSPA